ncbi:DMT family transporter [Candidatus Parcubacteria bacterium]|nr:MAG: DMT family transporter [Candidatus Parcubacteria bacterium]
MAKKLGPLFIIFAAFLWALDGIVLTPKLYGLPVPLVVFIEHLLAFLLMLPFFISEWRELKKMRRGDWQAILWVAVFGGALGTMFITKALFYVNFVNLSIVILIQKLQPLFALALAVIILKERPPKKFFVWAAAAIIGVYLATFGLQLPNLDTGDKTAAAALFALGAAFAFGSSTVFSKKALANISFRTGTYLRFGLTALLMLFIAGAEKNFSVINQITGSQFIVFLIIALTTGGTAIFLYYYGLKWVSASVSTICELAFPLSAIVLEYLIRGNALNYIQWAGAVILLYAIYKVSLIKNYN